jgi:hypothetical protein
MGPSLGQSAAKKEGCARVEGFFISVLETGLLLKVVMIVNYITPTDDFFQEKIR